MPPKATPKPVPVTSLPAVVLCSGTVVLCVKLHHKARRAVAWPPALRPLAVPAALAFGSVLLCAAKLHWHNNGAEGRRLPVWRAGLARCPTPAAIAAFWLVATHLGLLSLLPDAHMLAVAVTLQLLSQFALAAKVITGSGPLGVSARTLLLEAVVLSCRVFSFPLLAYVPKGSDLYPLFGDVVSLVLVVSMFLPVAGADEDGVDVFRTREVLLISAVGAANYQLHSTGVRSVDIAWSAAAYIDVFALLPQLWLISRSGGVTEATVGHHIAATFLARLALATFWWRKCLRLDGAKSPAWVLFGACAFQVVLLLRFMGFYAHAFVSHGFVGDAAVVCVKGMELPQPQPQPEPRGQQ